ncbi:MAG: alpha/beta fold hydrolase [Phycisphaeraceae bacterium]
MKRTACGFACLVVCAYAVVFACVSCSTSPTDQRLMLDDGRALAYLAKAGGDKAGGRVVFLHGTPADANAWNRLLKRADDIDASELVVVDRIGFGNSTSEDELALAGHAEAVAPLLESVNGRKPIVVGHSYGGPVALRLAVDYPDKVGAVVLVAGACDATMDDAQWFRKLIDAVRLVVPEDWERGNRELLALTDENKKMRPMLGGVRCPVFVVHGTWDGVCPHDATLAYLQAELTGATKVEVVSLERAGHNLHLYHLDEVIDAVNNAAADAESGAIAGD